MDSVTVDTKRALIEQKLQMWRNTLYANEIDAKLAEQFIAAKLKGGEQMLEEAKAAMKQCVAAIALLEGLLKELDAGGESRG